MGKRAVLLLSLLALVSCSPSGSVQQVAVVVDGETLIGATGGPAVRDALADLGVSLNEDDRVEPAETSVVEDGMTIRVIRVETVAEVRRRIVAFERRTVIDATIPTGETRLLEPGQGGVEELTYRVRREDGVQVERTLVQRVMLEEPRPEVVLVGGQVEVAPVVLDGTVASLSGGNIWLIRTTSANRWRLTHSGDLDGRVFRLSPDGAYILFTRTTTGTASVEGDDSGRAPFNTLWLMETNPGATKPVQLAVDNVLWADWEPSCGVWNMGSGCRIAFTTGAPAPGSPGWRAANDLVVAQPDPENGQLVDEHQIIAPSSGGVYGWWGTTYAWAPDGQRLAYARADQIGAVAVPTGTLTTLASFPPYRTYAAWVWAPTVSWSSDSAFIISVLHSPPESDPVPQDSHVFDIWTIAADGTLQARIVRQAGMWAAPQYAWRRGAVAYGQSRSPTVSGTSGYDLYVMDRDGSSARHLFPSSKELGLDYPEFAWAPFGNRLIAVYRGNLYLVSPADGTSFSLTGDGHSTLVDWR